MCKQAYRYRQVTILGRKGASCSVYGENKHRISPRAASLGRHHVRLHMKNEQGHGFSFGESNKTCRPKGAEGCGVIEERMSLR